MEEGLEVLGGALGLAAVGPALGTLEWGCPEGAAVGAAVRV